MRLDPSEEGIVHALLCKARIDAVHESNRAFEAEDFDLAEYWHNRAVTICTLLDREFPATGPYGLSTRLQNDRSDDSLTN